MKKRYWVLCRVAVEASHPEEAKALIDVKSHQIQSMIKNLGAEFCFDDYSFGVMITDEPFTDDDIRGSIDRSKINKN